MKIYLEKNLLGIDNYKQIIDINDDLIKLSEITIKGKSLKVKSLDPHKIVLSGDFTTLYLGDKANELQDIDEKRWFF